MGSQSYPSLQPSCDSMEMSFNMSQTLLIPTRGTRFNWQQRGPPVEHVGEVMPNQPDLDLNEGEGSVSRTSTPKTTTDKVTRKREIDRAYRQRQKQKIMDRESETNTLKEENANLRNENQSLKLEHALMTQNLQSKETEIYQLKSNLDELKCDSESQQALVQVLSAQLACQDLPLENAQLSQNLSLDCTIIQVVEENECLKRQNRILKVQNDALCGKIIKDDDKKHMLEN